MARPKKIVEEKKEERIELVNEPAKIMKVIFRVPTSVPYESVEVEVSGLASLEEVKGKYNQIVESFRPAPKPPKPQGVQILNPPMAPYSVPRKVPAADDEAGGAVIREETVDDNTLTLQKLDVVSLLEEKHNFMCKGKSRKEISDKVFDITGILLEDSNLGAIIDALKK